MNTPLHASTTPTHLAPHVVKASREEPLFHTGDAVRVSDRHPVGHYRVPNFIRGRSGTVEKIIEPRAVDNEEEGFGRNSGIKGYYYRISIPLTSLWPEYDRSHQDGLRIEVFETWLEKL